MSEFESPARTLGDCSADMAGKPIAAARRGLVPVQLGVHSAFSSGLQRASEVAIVSTGNRTELYVGSRAATRATSPRATHSASRAASRRWWSAKRRSSAS